MRKYIPAGILLLLYLPVIAQEEGRGTRKEFNTAEHVIQVSPTIKSFSIQLPVNAQLQESLEGRLLYRTTVKKSTLHGLWQSWYGNGQTCDSGRLVRNIPDGEWIIRNRAGQLMAVRTFNADGYHRVLEEIKRPNPKRNFYHLGQIAIQNRNLALHFLQAEYSFPDKRKDAQFHSVQYQKGIREGYWIHRESPSSETRSGTYRHGLKDQEWKIYSPDGRLQEIILYRKGTLRWQKQFRH
jgi:hypothetical protein